MLRVLRGTILQRSGLYFTNLLRFPARRCKTTHCVDSWTVSTISTGIAEIETHFTTYIKSIDPLESIEYDYDMMKLFEDGDDTKAPARLSLNIALPDDSDVVINEEFFDKLSKDISYNPQLNIKRREHYLVVKGKPQRKLSFPPEDISITIEVPLQFNLKVNAADDADVHINNLEGGWIYDITTDKGNCYVSSIKGTDLHVKTNHGNIISKSTLLAEFATLEAGNTGEISVGKLQGRKFCLDSESGNISTGPLYLQRGEVNTESGSVKLGDIHGIIDVKVQEGDISVSSVTGDLSAETSEGNISIHLSQSTNIDLTTKQGDILATIETSQQPTTVNAKAKEIIFGSDVDVTKSSEDTGETFTTLEAAVNSSNKLEDGVCKLKAEAKQGTFKMDHRDWFSSLGLTLTNKHET